MRKKARVLIQLHYLEIGGAEKALLGLLSAIDPRKVEVDLFLNQHTGVYMDQIPKHVRLLPEINEYAAIERPIIQAFKISPKIAMKRLLAKLSFRRYLKKGGSVNCASHFYMDRLISSLPSLEDLGEYDLAVSFLDPPHIVQDKVLARRKVEWIHTDFNAIDYDTNLTERRWSENDAIISISSDITLSFGNVFPKLKSKLVEMENIIDKDDILEKCDDIPFEYPDNFDGVILLTIGRLNSYPKNMLCIPLVARKLKSFNLNFRWFIMGPGDQNDLRKSIRENEVADCVQLLGEKSNPYPYIKECSIYVQPSISEGKSIAIREAQILCKPVVITRYPTSGAQVKDGVDGVICGMGNDDIASTIYDLSTDKEKRAGITSYLRTNDYCLKSEVKKFYKLIP